MILIPEQVKALRDKIKELEEDIDNATVYFDEVTSRNDRRQKEEQIEYLRRILEESELVKRADDTIIDYGTKFKIRFDKENVEEIYTLAENEIGLKSDSFNQDNGYVSVKGLLGSSVKGKKEGDNFRYSVKVRGIKDTLTITGKVLKVFRKTKNDVDFIISRPMSERLATRKIVKEDIDCKENEITLSQYNLLQEEKKRLVNALLKFKKYEKRIMPGSIIKLIDAEDTIKEFRIVDEDVVNPKTEIKASSKLASRLFAKKIGDRIEEIYTYKEEGKTKKARYFGTIIEIDNSNVTKVPSVYYNIYSVRTRLDKLNRLLNKVRIITSHSNDTVGIGSKVSIMTFEDGKIQNIRVEVINKALSSEDTHSYVEVTSAIGSAIIGLKDNETFYYYDRDGLLHDGVVYDINNNMNETLAKDPTAYQKKRRG